ncbi:RdgB/HAM1 family non-canonical purine NTP pyrophosphatase [Flavobacteriaceae bacterium]|nr:RdgB/HAM1 family non-canonical purine NTP pyrophosphatase [Flavobacteriaceae bacterium]MDB9712531.1 RdgB/HAM1 family non-canonical purine NTP pyrophosphatase [Flavobacteriaceae bacterium]MDC1492303.1 RdgB/HAM1 family non-canonical purine NTP pyrophosphatase [Flavobacteriaceae bacterium]
MKLIFATSNKNKITEVQALLNREFDIQSLEDINCYDEIVENKDTIEGNAILKAKYVYGKYNIDCFADDTGLEVESLNGLPGVMSKRFSGLNYSAEKNIIKLLKLMKLSSNRKATFKTVIALILNGQLSVFTGICEGEIISTKKGSKGFGYDPVFKPNGQQFTFAEMDLEIKNKIGHRAKAINKLIDFLSEK